MLPTVKRQHCTTAGERIGGVRSDVCQSLGYAGRQYPGSFDGGDASDEDGGYRDSDSGNAFCQRIDGKG